MPGKSKSAKNYAKNPASRAKKLAYDKKFQKRAAQVKKRVEANKANRKAQKAGTARKGDGKDASHMQGGGIRMVKQSVNRSFNGSGKRAKRVPRKR